MVKWANRTGDIKEKERERKRERERERERGREKITNINGFSLTLI